MTKNMTAGSPAKLILIFTFPLLIGNIFQQFYSMADTLIVGRTIGVNALAAVGCTGSISFLILGFVSGLTSGFSILTAQRFGAGDADGVKKKFCRQYSAQRRCFSGTDCDRRMVHPPHAGASADAPGDPWMTRRLICGLSSWESRPPYCLICCPACCVPWGTAKHLCISW